MLTDEQVKERLERAPAQRVTEEALVAEIADVAYLYHGHTTICIITVRNGFKFVGHTTPAYADNFDSEIGKKDAAAVRADALWYAYDNAFKQMWPVYGFMLKQHAYEGR